MALAEGQFQIRDLVMGPGTDYGVLGATNPFTLNVRADQTSDRAWNHGSTSGAEWAAERIVPLRIQPEADDMAAGTWLGLHQQLTAAFAPVGDTANDVEMRFALGGTEYLMFGRPRMVEPETRHIGAGVAPTQCAFVGTDPLIYSGDLLTSDPIPLPVQAGGLLVPFTVPFTIGGTLLGGSAELVNAGTAPSPIVFRIDGPVEEPFVAVQHPATGTVNTIRCHFDLPSGQFVLINTGARTVFLQGLPQASRRGQVTAEDDWPLLQPGVNEIRFGAGEHNDQAALTVETRSAWW